MVRILGIDPGSVKTGYGIIESNGQQSRYVHSGYLKLPADNLASIINSKPPEPTESVEKAQDDVNVPVYAGAMPVVDNEIIGANMTPGQL